VTAFTTHKTGTPFDRTTNRTKGRTAMTDDEKAERAERLRLQELASVNADPGSREALEAKHGQVWDTEQLQRDFTVEGFMAPFVVARRKSDGVLGSLKFQHSPRLYFGFQPHDG
jgi:hypothetical protein